MIHLSVNQFYSSLSTAAISSISATDIAPFPHVSICERILHRWFPISSVTVVTSRLSMPREQPIEVLRSQKCSHKFSRLDSQCVPPDLGKTLGCEQHRIERKPTPDGDVGEKI